jgi:hypothetical protein
MHSSLDEHLYEINYNLIIIFIQGNYYFLTKLTEQ